MYLWGKLYKNKYIIYIVLRVNSMVSKSVINLDTLPVYKPITTTIDKQISFAWKKCIKVHLQAHRVSHRYLLNRLLQFHLQQ